MSFEDNVRDELNRVGATLPVIGVRLDRTMSRGRSIRRRKMLANLAVAAAVTVFAVGGGILLTTAREPAPRPGPAGTPSDQATPGPSPSQAEDELSFGRVEPVLREWLTAIQESDEDHAWSLMTSEAQALVGRSEFDRMMQSELPEGLGAFADAENFHYIVVTTEPHDARVVGVVSGEVTREASTEFAAMAIPMRLRREATLIDDAIVDRTRYWDRQAVFASASAGPQAFRSGDKLTVEFARPEAATASFIALDADRQPLPTQFDPETGQAVAKLDRDLQEGRHIATVIVVDESGRLYAEPIIFEAEAP